MLYYIVIRLSLPSIFLFHCPTQHDLAWCPYTPRHSCSHFPPLAPKLSFPFHSALPPDHRPLQHRLLHWHCPLSLVHPFASPTTLLRYIVHPSPAHRCHPIAHPSGPPSLCVSCPVGLGTLPVVPTKDSLPIQIQQPAMHSGTHQRNTCETRLQHSIPPLSPAISHTCTSGKKRHTYIPQEIYVGGKRDLPTPHTSTPTAHPTVHSHDATPPTPTHNA